MAQVKIYTKSNCPYCDRAKELLKRKGSTYEEIHLDDDPAQFNELRNKTGLMTVPQIFIDNKLVGGFSELSGLDKAGQLDKMLGI
jgi:glutaredoxin 3